MSITLKKDVWKVKDPSTGNYRGAAILSTTLPEDAAQIIEDTEDLLDIEQARATGIIEDTEEQMDAIVADIDDQLNNTTDGIIPVAQGIVNTLQTQQTALITAIDSALQGGTDDTLTQADWAADAKAVGDALKADLAAEYVDTGKAYAVGDYCLHNNALYRCTTAIGSAGEAWTAGHWAQVPVGDELVDLRSAISDVEEIVRGETERYTKLSVTDHVTVSDTHEITFEQGDVLNFLVDYEDSANVSNNRYSILVYNGTTFITEIRQTLGTVLTWKATSNVTKITFYIQLISAVTTPYKMSSFVNVSDGLVEEVKLIKEDIQDIFPITNLIDTNDPDYEENKAVKSSTGETTSSVYFDATGFIKLKPNTKYYIGGLYLTDFFAFFNNDKSAVITAPTMHVVPSLIYSESNYHGWFETGNDVCYFRGSINKNYLSSAYLSEYYDEYRVRTQDCVVVSPSFNNLVNDYMGKNVLIIGDSISTGSSSARLNSNMPSYASYEKWVDDLINIGYLPSETTYNCSQHATGFVAKAGSASWIDHSDFLNRIKYFENQGTWTPSEIDIVIIFGGINDQGTNIPIGADETDGTVYFTPAVKDLFDYLLNNYTQARICVFLPTLANRDGGSDTVAKVHQYTDVIKEEAKNRALPLLDLTDGSGFYPFNTAFKNTWTYKVNGTTPDGLHPNQDYQELYLAPMIKHFLDGMM